MSGAFKRSSERYGDGAPPGSPYLRAAQVWDDRIGSSRAQARNWRLMALGCLGLAAIALGGFIYAEQDTHIATYVVPVDRYGRPGRIELAGRSYNPTQAETGYFVADWVRLVRSKSTDPIVLRDNWNQAYRFIQGDGAVELSHYARDHNPFEKIGQEAVAVEVTSVLPRGASSYQVQWREIQYLDGAPAPTIAYTGLFTVTHKDPHTEAELRANPLGIFITSFQWSREL